MKFNLYIKVLLLIIIILAVGLTINLWLYFQPSLFELQLTSKLQLGTPNWLTILMKVISDSYVAASIICASVCIASLYQKKYATAAIFATSLASLLLIDPLKLFFQRPRPIPEAPIIDYISGTSFPSGHAYTATVLAGVLCVAYAVRWHGRNVRTSVILAAVYITLVCWSRVYLEVHYPSDVIGGVLFGLMVLLGIIILYRYLRKLSG